MENRIENLVKRLPDDMDAVIVTSSTNRRYFTGLASSAGTLLVTREKAYFIIDFRYIELAKKTIKGCEITLQKKLGEQVCEILKKHQIKKLGIESGYLTIEKYLALQADFKDTEIEICLDNKVNEIIAAQRMIKSKSEVESIKRAQQITDKTFEYALSIIKPGRSEKEIMLDMEMYSRKIGSECASFDFIVVSGVNSSLPHGVPSEKLIENGDFLTMDFGAVINGYHSDMTRTVAVGCASEEQRHIYDTVLQANLKSIEAVKSGIKCSVIDKIARDIITEAGFGDNFGHGLGHSVGLEIHEEPRFNTTSEALCEVGQIMTIEPGIYLEGKFGCRIEDMVYITENGCINLTNSSKELIVV